MNRYSECMTPEDRQRMDVFYKRVTDLLIEKAQYLPEEHKADIRKLMEEGA